MHGYNGNHPGQFPVDQMNGAAMIMSNDLLSDKQPIYGNGVNHSATQPEHMLIPSENFKALTKSLSKKETLDDKVEKSLGRLTEDVLSEILELACRISKHRKSRTL